MPKSQFVSPSKMREPKYIKFNDIPVNQYSKTLAEEKKSFTKQELMNIYRDMYAVREFETMLQQIKQLGSYADKEFTYPGPAHLSLGQEATAVGQAFWLGADDFIFGNHRSHGEVLAKGFSAIEKLSDEELMKIMQEYKDGELLEVVRDKNPETKTVKELAMDFFIYGLIAELFAKENGFNRGLGGSMHAFFLPFGIYPNNAIVGGAVPIATGAALFKKCNKKPGVIVANSGDGSVGCGPVWESLNFAAMDQFNDLWPDEYKGGLPIIFHFNNNHYGMGGQTKGETMAYSELARIGAGVSPSQLHAERIDGFNPLAVIDAYKRKLEIIKKGKGPVLLDVVTYRFCGHSTSDAMSYRTSEEIDQWRDVDPISVFRKELVEAEICSEQEIEELINSVVERNKRMFLLASDPTVTPYVDMDRDSRFIEKYMFSNQKVEKMEDREAVVNHPKEENPRVKQIKTKARYAFDDKGNPIPKSKQYTLRDGLFEAIFDKFYTDPTLISYGEDVRDWNGAFAVYRGLTEALPYNRLFNAPISEAAIVGSAVGYGMAGGRAIVELMYCDFIGRAGDEVFNQLAKWQSMSAGYLKMPVVLRVSVGSKYGAQHSQDFTSLVSHIPGLKVVFPATPYDAKGLMTAALNQTDPVVFFESQRIYDMGEMFYKPGVPENSYEIEIGQPDIKRPGKDITILTIGATLYRALDAAKILSENYSVEAEVIDARSIVPFDYEKVIESVKKTGKIILSSDAVTRGSILNDMAQNITQMAFDYLDAPPVVVGAQNWITPAYEYDKYFFPQPEWIIDAIDQKLLPLKGHTPSKSYTTIELIRKARLGV